jgi:hypothetical protein
VLAAAQISVTLSPLRRDQLCRGGTGVVQVDDASAFAE